MKYSVVLPHLGESVPFYMRDCVEQIRLWNPPADTDIYILLDRIHASAAFWTELADKHGVTLVYTDSLVPTPHHTYFATHFKGDTAFRKGYWKHVKERFYYVEELMAAFSLEHVISMEYDVLLYTTLRSIVDPCRAAATLRMVRDNEDRGHPALLYIPSTAAMADFTQFLTTLLDSPLEDMQSLAAYADRYPAKIHYFPVITEARNRSVPVRRSKQGHTTSRPGFLSEDSETFGLLFDSLVVGQWIGGIDSRNTGGHKVANYENESALYSIREMPFTWKRSEGPLPAGRPLPLSLWQSALARTLWQPFLDGRPLATIHVHSKSLASFRSDRETTPTDDYDVRSLHAQLFPN